MRRVQRRRIREWLRDHDETITVKEAGRLGSSARHLGAMVASGELRRPGKGVFVDTVRGNGPRTQLRVALCLGGRDAVASHLSAAALWGLVDRPPPRPTITVPRARSTWAVRKVPVVVHRTRRRPIVRRCAGMAVTDPVRTLVDLAPTMSDGQLDSLLDRAFERDLVSTSSLARGLAAARRCPGAAALRRCLARRGGLDLPEQSILEGMMNRLVADLHRKHGLPLPRREYSPPGERIRFDYAWPEVRLDVEVDGFKWHSKEQHLIRDHNRRNSMTMVGWSQLGFTWSQVRNDPEGVGDQILGLYRRLEGNLERAQALSSSVAAVPA